MWDFSTEPAFQEKLDWVEQFVREEIYPLEVLDLDDESFTRLATPLKQKVKEMGLWAAHLDPALGGQGFGQVKLALLNEILGRSVYGPPIFGNQAPDAGNAEILALYGTDEQKERYLWPLLDGRIRSCFSMTEPGAGSDPTLIKTRAERKGDEWVINGHKWFSSHAKEAAFLIVMAVTNRDVDPRHGMSMIIVPTETPGVNISREIDTMAGHPGDHGHFEILYESVRVPYGNLLGKEGEGFVIAQKRLGPGRIQHCTRWLGQCQRAFDMMCERAVSRYTHGSYLSEKQTIQNWIADSYVEMQTARLLTLYAAWKIDARAPSAARTEISMIKFWGAKVLHDVIDRALQVHGSLGFSTDLPLEAMYRNARAARIYDGPDEIHRVTVAREILKRYQPGEGPPSEHIPTRREAAQRKFAHMLDELVANL